jgi:UDP-N-acetylmuramoyl-tripeptide--D-alanyl-D-alanine ligase
MISRMHLSELVSPLEAQLRGDDAGFSRVVTDSRADVSGGLFVALSGDNFDGHAFVDSALSSGAAAAMVETGKYRGTTLEVKDTLRALGQLGQINRARFEGPVVGLTGSVGKTTCKEMLASIFAQRWNVLATAGNRNNEIGVPLTLLDIEAAHEAAVIEMGAAEQGDIAYLNQWVQPDVSLVTTVAASHIGRFGSIETIARTKAEIYTHNSEDAVACVNLDNQYTRAMLLDVPQKQVVTFSRFESGADVRAENAAQHSDGCWSFTLCFPQGEAEVLLPIMGEHNITNALAAAAAALSAGLSLEEVVAGLSAFKSAGRRLQQHTVNGGVLIDDCYNANPESMNAAIDVLAQREGKRILICGDMGELGAYSEDLHRQVGDYANGRVDAVWSIGEESRLISTAFSAEGKHFDSQAELLEACKKTMTQGVVMLVKGSRSALLDRVVDALVEAGEVH